MSSSGGARLWVAAELACAASGAGSTTTFSKASNGLCLGLVRCFGVGGTGGSRGFTRGAAWSSTARLRLRRRFLVAAAALRARSRSEAGLVDSS